MNAVHTASNIERPIGYVASARVLTPHPRFVLHLLSLFQQRLPAFSSKVWWPGSSAEHTGRICVHDLILEVRRVSFSSRRLILKLEMGVGR